MGVYIKGMEMPTSCIACPLNFGEKRPEYGLTICCPYSDGVILWRDKAFDNVRLASCGIVPVQPHGRLIDTDALIKYLRNVCFHVHGNYDLEGLTSYILVDAIKTAPTIIESEE